MDAVIVRDAGNRIIGVYGPSGIVEDVIETAIRRFKRDKLFQIIVTATVTNKSDLAGFKLKLSIDFGKIVSHVAQIIMVVRKEKDRRYRKSPSFFSLRFLSFLKRKVPLA
ncbi:hypothetical protein VNO77_01125 [Canavalia gladiata]|uniref:Uncharacterized protein n=1 Tax=Canavalia gladiata TaxID=3824 RepID=A0AAN9R4P2_CANGL